ncbi:hypothetical protein [Paenibacillus cremeus]|uniref:Uncharacterized protein n=1 Tax=Paenibacillus cremeus TaxID=2163881 RepID=A0A559K522_9BACL|nr:hypothetical protein [Paenibacillus cremeus]TVY07190.1 hypothetical protein FPZ49_25100 [Paenibacillus cremeus]
MNELLQIKGFFEKLGNIRDGRFYGSLSDLESLISESEKMLELTNEVMDYMHEVRMYKSEIKNLEEQEKLNHELNQAIENENV